MSQDLSQVLDALERALASGGNPGPLLRGLRIGALTGWPDTPAAAAALRLRLAGLGVLVGGLERPLRGALGRLDAPAPYGPGPALPGPRRS